MKCIYTNIKSRCVPIYGVKCWNSITISLYHHDANLSTYKLL